MAVLHQLPFGDIELFEVDADPSGAVTAPAGSLALRTDGSVYTNTDGAVAWSSLAPVPVPNADLAAMPANSMKVRCGSSPGVPGDVGLDPRSVIGRPQNSNCTALSPIQQIGNMLLGAQDQTLSGNETLITTDPRLQYIDGGASDRKVILPAEAIGEFWAFYNAGSTNQLDIRDDADAVSVIDLAPGNGALVMTNSAGTAWVALPTAAGQDRREMPICTVVRTTDYVATSTHTDLTFDTTLNETNAAVIEHGNVNTDEVTVKETGNYLVSGRFIVENTSSGSETINLELRINGVAYANMGFVVVKTTSEVTAPSIPLPLTANDVLTVSVQDPDGGSDVTLKANTVFYCVRLSG